MEEKVRVAAAQVSPVFMDKEATIDKACKTIEMAGKAGARLVVFSETFVPGYPYWRGILPISKWSKWMVEYQKNSVEVPGPDVDLLCEASREAAIITVMGCSEMSDVKGSSTLYNTILFINSDGKLLGRHRKIMPTHAERMIWGMGSAEDIAVFDTPIGRIGGLVCYEHHMTLQKAAMAALGEEIHCALWPGWWVMEHHPGDKRRWKDGDPPHSCDIEHAIREYAFENQVFVISVGQYIPDDVMPLDCRDFNVAAGGSFIANPAGVIMAGPVFNREEILYADLAAEDRGLTKAYFDTLGHYSRPDLFKFEIKRGEFSGNGFARFSQGQDSMDGTTASRQSSKRVGTKKRGHRE
ncbi:MAG: carbon-nitrogen hydrolase family protein [Methanomassiliicoccales archaeon]|jgi:amidase/nitrilase|nr:carbon-nitrogen hydrolase family protein [Methanomassiliicoccales archaeon]